MAQHTKPPAVQTGARLEALAAAVGGEIGHPFLERLVMALRDAMDAALVLITLGEGRPMTRARAVFALKGGAPVENVAYDLEGTPCLLVYRGETVVIPVDLARRFPKEAGLVGYAGVPVRDADLAVIGHLAVFSATPIADADAVRSIVRIFGARVEADLRHRRLCEEREALIEDLVRSNQALRERSQALHDANKFKTQLVGMIAHDLRNPLAALMARAELLQTRLSRPRIERSRAERDVAKLQALADRLSGLIEATLSRCRAESAAVEVRPRRTDVAALARTALETNRGAARRKNIRLVGPEDTPVWCCVDEGLCLEAVDNLVSNAVKYSLAGCRVEVRVSQSAEGVAIAVADEGPGLTEEDLARAFMPFQTLSARPTGGETATGLGLANVRRIAEAHGGAVTAESRGAGCGATFVLSLPHRAEGRVRSPGAAP